MKPRMLFALSLLTMMYVVLFPPTTSLATFVTSTKADESRQADPATGPVENWSSDIYSSSACYPAVAGSLVYFTCEDGQVYALERDSGEKRWQHDVGGTVLCAPVVQGQYLIVGTGSGKVVALNASTGSEQWRHKSNRKIINPPLIKEGRAFVGTGSSLIYALDLENGKRLWKRRLDKIKYPKGGGVKYMHLDGESVVSTPVDLGERIAIAGMAMQAQRKLLADIIVRKGFVNCISKETGKVVWKWSSENTNSMIPPVLIGDSIYVHQTDGSIVVLDGDSGDEISSLSIDGLTVSSGFILASTSLFVWSEKGNVLRFDTESWEKEWGAVVWPKIVSRPLANSSGFYVFTEDGTLHSFEPGSGKIKWKYSLGGVPASAPVLHRGVIYTWLTDGRFHAVRVDEGSDENKDN